jgi:hypothetical protein
VKVRACGSDIGVRDTPVRYPFPPVTLTIEAGAAYVQDYLTVEQARELALMLLAAAERNEVRR